jgi:hypothetical protein
VIASIEKGRKEDGNRSIADKIIKRLHDLDKTVEKNHGRWAWELLQNAKDSIADEDERQVAVQLILKDNEVEFRHNGAHFTEQDIRGLINQISSKEIEDDQPRRKTGKFGTGFLTTHLLSKAIRIDGIVETEIGKLFSFGLVLDRDGKTTTQLIPKIEKAWAEFHSSAKPITKIDPTAYNTCFKYHLGTKKQKDIAKIGVEEFLQLIPFVLAFNPKIHLIEIIQNGGRSKTSFQVLENLIDDIPVLIQKTADTKKEIIEIFTLQNDKVQIAVELVKKGNDYLIKDCSSFPKIFCDFPLIGSESFHFPVLINSFHFNPLTERDGIWLKGDEDPEVRQNKELIESGFELYKKLIEEASERKYKSLYNLVDTSTPSSDPDYFDKNWYKEIIQLPMREFLWESSIVEPADNSENYKAIKDTWFPLKKYPSEIRDKIWTYYFDLYPAAICAKEEMEHWCDLTWDNWNGLSYEELMTDISNKKTLGELAEALAKNNKDTFDWLNEVCNFILEDESHIAKFEKFSLIPNKNLDLKSAKTEKGATNLFIDEINDPKLIKILSLLGEDWNAILLHQSVSFGQYHVKKKENIANVITQKLRNASSDSDVVTAISLLSEWFERNMEDGPELFPELYAKRAELFMNTIQDKDSLYKVMRSKTGLAKLSEVVQAIDENPEILSKIKSATDLENLFGEFNVANVDELRSLIYKSQNVSNESKIVITSEVLASLGLSTVEELEEMLEDTDFANKFVHHSKPNTKSFLIAQSLIKRAKQNIIDYLLTLSDYDCSEIEELATTVLGGIKKEGLPIHVVVRPSDFGYVIVYFSSEKDTLDYANAELWIDNGKEEPRHLTLGKILKTTGINKIPI